MFEVTEEDQAPEALHQDGTFFPLASETISAKAEIGVYVYE